MESSFREWASLTKTFQLQPIEKSNSSKNFFCFPDKLKLTHTPISNHTVINIIPRSRIIFLRGKSVHKALNVGIRNSHVAYLALSKVADADFPTAPNPTPTARPSERERKFKNSDQSGS